MPLNPDSYSTTIGSSFDTKRVIVPIKEAIVTDDLETQETNTLGFKPYGGFHPLFITGSHPSENKIPPFPHPISVSGIRGKNFICTDLRLVLRENKGGLFSERIKNYQEYTFLLNRHNLCTLWMAGRASEFRTSLRFGAYAFSSWLSGVIGHLKGLDTYQRLVVQVVLLCYYSDLTHTLDEIKDPLYRTGQGSWINGILKDAVRDIDEILYKVGKTPMENLDDVINRIKKVLDSPLLSNLTSSTVMSTVRSHWWGHGVEPQKIVGVALEHPPTWCALVIAALDYSGYKNSLIAQSVTKLGKKDEQEAFVMSLDSLIGSTVRLESIADVVNQLPREDHFDYNVEDLVLRAEQTPDFGVSLP